MSPSVDPHILVAFLVAAGFLIGSFLATLVVRFPAGAPIIAARSACPACGRRLSPLELVPVLSWAAQLGRCRGCGAQISPFYPAMEIAAAIVPAWASFEASGAALILSCVLGWFLVALAAFDLSVRRLPDILTLPLLVLGLGATTLLNEDLLIDHMIGVVAGFAILFGIAFVYRQLRNREGLGLGDAKLFAAAGAWLGWRGLAPALLIGTLTALLAIVIARAVGRTVDATSRVPLGAFLALGIWIIWLYALTV
jgi:leader peptidase (prepilin peptidase)/N-methyltransferase